LFQNDIFSVAIHISITCLFLIKQLSGEDTKAEVLNKIESSLSEFELKKSCCDFNKDAVRSPNGQI